MILTVKLEDDFVVVKKDVTAIQYGVVDPVMGRVLHYDLASVDGNKNGGGFRINRIKEFELK